MIYNLTMYKLFEEFLEFANDLAFAEDNYLIVRQYLCVAIDQYTFACADDSADIGIRRQTHVTNLASGNTTAFPLP